jgi:hypothetical protein
MLAAAQRPSALCPPVCFQREQRGCRIRARASRATAAAKKGVSAEWVGLLDPGEGTTESFGRSKRPALKAKGTQFVL